EPRRRRRAARSAPHDISAIDRVPRRRITRMQHHRSSPTVRGQQLPVATTRHAAECDLLHSTLSKPAITATVDTDHTQSAADLVPLLVRAGPRVSFASISGVAPRGVLEVRKQPPWRFDLHLLAMPFAKARPED